MAIKMEVNDYSAQYLKQMKGAVSKALTECGHKAERYAKELCPFDTGTLRNSITHKVIENPCYVGTNVEYAPYVEFGTSKMGAREYLRPAVNDHADEWKNIIRENLGFPK